MRCAHFRQVRFRCANLAIDAASGRVVDKRIVAIPEGVSGVQNISLGKVYGDVRIGMSGAVVLEGESGAVGVNRVLVLENSCRDRSSGRGRKSVNPAFNARVHGKTLARILVRQNACSRLVQPLVAAGVIEVPVRVDELFDGIRIDAGESRRDVRPRGDDFRIDEKLSVRTRKNGDVSSGTKQDADIAPKRLHRDLGCGGFLKSDSNQAFLRKEPGRGETGGRNRDTTRNQKLTPRNFDSGAHSICSWSVSALQLE